MLSKPCYAAQVSVCRKPTALFLSGGKSLKIIGSFRVYLFIEIITDMQCCLSPGPSAGSFEQLCEWMLGLRSGG